LIGSATSPTAQQLNSDWLQRIMVLLMEIYDDSAGLVLPFDCQAVRQLAALHDQPMHIKKLLVGVLSSQSVRSNFSAQGCLQLHEVLNPMSYECNKPATISYLIGFMEQKLVIEQQLLDIHAFLQKCYIATISGECLEIIGLLSRLANLLFNQMLLKTTFMDNAPFMRPEFILDYLKWVHALLQFHKDADVMYKELLSNVAVFVVCGYEYLLAPSKQEFTELILHDKYRQEPVDWRARNASYLVLAAITTEATISQQVDLVLLKLAVQEFSDPRSIKLGILELFLAYARKERSANIVAD